MVRRLFPPAYTGRGPAGCRAGLPGAGRHRPGQPPHPVPRDCWWRRPRPTSLSEEEFLAWLDAVGSLRLVLGTRLDVHEDMEAPDPQDPRAAEYGLFLFLGELQYLMVELLADGSARRGAPRRRPLIPLLKSVSPIRERAPIV